MEVNAPLFHLQIVRAGTDVVARFPGGGPLEVELVETLVSHLKDRGLLDATVRGLEVVAKENALEPTKPTPTWWQKVRATFTATELPDGKPGLRPFAVPSVQQVEAAIREAVTAALMSLKDQTKYIV